MGELLEELRGIREAIQELTDVIATVGGLEADDAPERVSDEEEIRARDQKNLADIMAQVTELWDVN